MTVFIRIALLLLLTAASLPLSAQRLALRTNTLEWLALSPNLALEARLSNRVTLDFSLGGCPFNGYPGVDDFKWKHLRFTPALRYWFNRPMARHFVGVNVSAAVFNARFRDRRYEGDLFSAGVDYGYDLVLSRHWNLEFLVGVGIGKARGYDFKTTEARPKVTNMSRWIPVPRLGVSFTYVIK